MLLSIKIKSYINYFSVTSQEISQMINETQIHYEFETLCLKMKSPSAPETLHTFLCTYHQ